MQSEAAATGGLLRLPGRRTPSGWSDLCNLEKLHIFSGVFFGKTLALV